MTLRPDLAGSLLLQRNGFPRVSIVEGETSEEAKKLEGGASTRRASLKRLSTSFGSAHFRKRTQSKKAYRLAMLSGVRCGIVSPVPAHPAAVYRAALIIRIGLQMAYCTHPPCAVRCGVRVRARCDTESGTQAGSIGFLCN